MSKDTKKIRIIKYKNPEIYDVLDKIPLFNGMRNHHFGEIVRFKNNSLAQIIRKRKTGRKALVFISSKKCIKFNKINLSSENEIYKLAKIN